MTIGMHAATTAATGSPVMRIASVPSTHPYVARVTESSAVRRLPDPIPPGADDGVWWPPVVLDPEWIVAHRADADLLHIHFGTESSPAGRLTACLEAAREAGWPVVFTVHDLEHPQLQDQTPYLRQLDELIPSVDALITLTEGAADAVASRWGHRPEVIAHPGLLPASVGIPAVRANEVFHVGIHLNDLRPNVDGPGTVAALSEALALLGERGIDASAEVWMRRKVRDERARDEVRARCAADPGITLIEHERLSDAELAVTLSALDACVLPYRHGTHSGWVELCWDLGIPVAAPDLGYYREQHPDDVRSFAPGDPASLAHALASIEASETPAGSSARAQLAAHRRRLRVTSDAAAVAAHERLYRSLITPRRNRCATAVCGS